MYVLIKNSISIEDQSSLSGNLTKPVKTATKILVSLTFTNHEWKKLFIQH